MANRTFEQILGDARAKLAELNKYARMRQAGYDPRTAEDYGLGEIPGHIWGPPILMEKLDATVALAQNWSGMVAFGGNGGGAFYATQAVGERIMHLAAEQDAVIASARRQLRETEERATRAHERNDNYERERKTWRGNPETLLRELGWASVQVGSAEPDAPRAWCRSTAEALALSENVSKLRRDAYGTQHKHVADNAAIASLQAQVRSLTAELKEWEGLRMKVPGGCDSGMYDTAHQGKLRALIAKNLEDLSAARSSEALSLKALEDAQAERDNQCALRERADRSLCELIQGRDAASTAYARGLAEHKRRADQFEAAAKETGDAYNAIRAELNTSRELCEAQRGVIADVQRRELAALGERDEARDDGAKLAGLIAALRAVLSLTP